MPKPSREIEFGTKRPMRRQGQGWYNTPTALRPAPGLFHVCRGRVSDPVSRKTRRRQRPQRQREVEAAAVQECYNRQGKTQHNPVRPGVLKLSVGRAAMPHTVEQQPVPAAAVQARSTLTLGRSE
jgi:hypothetical protein